MANGIKARTKPKIVLNYPNEILFFETAGRKGTFILQQGRKIRPAGPVSCPLFCCCLNGVVLVVLMGHLTTFSPCSCCCFTEASPSSADLSSRKKKDRDASLERRNNFSGNQGEKALLKKICTRNGRQICLLSLSGKTGYTDRK